MEYQPPPAFGPPESRVGPLRPDQVWAGQMWTGQVWTESAGASAPPGYPPYPGALPYPGARGHGAYPVPPTRWRRMVIAAVATLTLIAAGLIAFVWANGPSPRTQRMISLPTSAGAYELIRPIDPASVQATFGNQLGPLSAALSSAQVGVYGLGPAAVSTLVFIGFNAADSADISSLLSSTSSDQVVDQVMTEAGATGGRLIGPGPLGGALECAASAQSGTPLTACAWADRDTLALLVQVGHVDIDTAGALALQFRAAAEH